MLCGGPKLSPLQPDWARLCVQVLKVRSSGALTFFCKMCHNLLVSPKLCNYVHTMQRLRQTKVFQPNLAKQKYCQEPRYDTAYFHAAGLQVSWPSVQKSFRAMLSIAYGHLTHHDITPKSTRTASEQHPNSIRTSLNSSVSELLLWFSDWFFAASGSWASHEHTADNRVFLIFMCESWQEWNSDWTMTHCLLRIEGIWRNPSYWYWIRGAVRVG